MQLKFVSLCLCSTAGSLKGHSLNLTLVRIPAGNAWDIAHTHSYLRYQQVRQPSGIISRSPVSPVLTQSMVSAILCSLSSPSLIHPPALVLEALLLQNHCQAPEGGSLSTSTSSAEAHPPGEHQMMMRRRRGPSHRSRLPPCGSRAQSSRTTTQSSSPRVLMVQPSSRPAYEHVSFQRTLKVSSNEHLCGATHCWPWLDSWSVGTPSSSSARLVPNGRGCKAELQFIYFGGDIAAQTYGVLSPPPPPPLPFRCACGSVLCHTF